MPPPLEPAAAADLSSRRAEILGRLLAALRADSGQTADAPWEPPVPLDGPPLPPFPAHTLPPWLRGYVVAEAEATQTPPDLAGLLALAVLSTACAGSVVVRPWGDWHEPVSLYTMVVLPPGHRKSAVFAGAARPILQFEAEAARRLAPAIARAESERAIDRHALRNLETAAARPADQSARQDVERTALKERAGQLAERLVARPLPPQPRLVVDDCSPERLATLLHEQGGRIAVLSPEGGIFDLMAGRYSTTGAPNFDHFLKGHAGDPIRVDRVDRPSEIVPRPAITMGLAVQPDVLRHLMSRPGFRGRGLLARFFYALPASPLGRRRVNPPPVPPPVRAAYEAHIRALLVAARQPAAEPHVLGLTEAAVARLERFAFDLEPRLGERGDLATLPDWAGKLVGLVVRLAGLLHLASQAGQSPPAPGAAASPEDATSSLAPARAGPIGDDTLAVACELGEYATAHARAAYAAMGDDPSVDARYVLGAIAALGKTRLAKQEIWQATKSRLRHARALDAALAVLIELGYLRERHVAPRRSFDGKPVRGRGPSPTLLLNPLATSGDHPSDRAGAPKDRADTEFQDF